MTYSRLRSLAACATLVLAGLSGSAAAEVTLPNDFDVAGQTLDSLYSYFGGVAGYSVTNVSTRIFSGRSARLDIAFQHDPFFGIAGVAVGTLGVSAPGLEVPAGASHFSATVRPPAAGVMTMTVILREDDNGDGLIDVENSDDEWEAGPFTLAPGVNVYNVPLSAFVDVNPETGNDLRGLSTTGRMAYILKFETRASYPGGIITTPVALHIDHVGLFAGAQSLPAAGVGDLNQDGLVNSNDLAPLLGAWGACPGPCPADLDGDGFVNSNDLAAMLGLWT